MSTNENNDKGTSKGTTSKARPSLTDAKRDEGIALASTVVATVKANYDTDLDATSAFGRWVKATTAGKRGQKVTLDALVVILDGAPGTSKGAMSKAMTVAATSAAQRRDYLTGLARDARPTVDGLYMSVRVVTPRKATTDAPATDEPTDAATTDESATFADTDAAKAAADFLAGLRTRGATRLQVSMVVDEMIRLTSPVRSAGPIAA